MQGKMITNRFLAALMPITFVAGQITFPVSTQTSFPSPSCTASSQTPNEQFTVNYNFESVERTDDLTAVSQIGVYNLLEFKNIAYVDTDPDFDGNHLGLAPHTYPSAASFSNNSNAAISVDYIESTVSSFTPRSFWYGCVLPSPYTAGSLPVNCTITATGYDKAGKSLASQQFDFKTNGSVVQDQNYATFNKGFANLHSLEFDVTNSVLGVGAALIDNFIATLYQQSCSAYYTGSYENGT